MKRINLNITAAPSEVMVLAKTALLTGVLMAFAPAVVMAAPLEKKGSTSYTSHYVFHPLGTLDVSGVGKVTALEMVGITENTKGEPAFDKLQAKCFAVNVETGGQLIFQPAIMKDKIKCIVNYLLKKSCSTNPHNA